MNTLTRSQLVRYAIFLWACSKHTYQYKIIRNYSSEWLQNSRILILHWIISFSITWDWIVINRIVRCHSVKSGHESHSSATHGSFSKPPLSPACKGGTPVYEAVYKDVPKRCNQAITRPSSLGRLSWIHLWASVQRGTVVWQISTTWVAEHHYVPRFRSELKLRISKDYLDSVSGTVYSWATQTWPRIGRRDVLSSTPIIQANIK